MRLRRRPARTAFFLGTNFSGSTLFGQALGAHPEVVYLGEVDRAVQFGPTMFRDEPEPPCYFGQLRHEACLLWTPELLSALRSLPYGQVHRQLGRELPERVLVDGSKHPSWLQAVGAEPLAVARSVAFITVRSPFAFADSLRYRTGQPMWEAANVWRDVYTDALRTVERLGLPALVVRHEEFMTDGVPVLQDACALLGVRYDPVMLGHRSLPIHDIGGNYGAYAAERNSEGDVVALAPRALASLTASPPEPAGARVELAWQRRTTLRDLEEVLHTPGLTDLAVDLGYRLSSDIAAWQLREDERSRAAPSAPRTRAEPVRLRILQPDGSTT